jgi:hypothetical protein
MWTVMGSGLALVDLSVVEQSYRAVLAVSRSEQKIVVAAHTASVFWVRDGYTDVIDRMTAVIELPDTSPPSPEQRGFWGYTAFDRGRREKSTATSWTWRLPSIGTSSSVTCRPRLDAPRTVGTSLSASPESSPGRGPSAGLVGLGRNRARRAALLRGPRQHGRVRRPGSRHERGTQPAARPHQPAAAHHRDDRSGV